MNARSVARVLLVLSSLAAVAAALGAWSVVADATSASAMAEAWRMVGYATFAALFALLAARPEASVGLWVVVLANKAVLATSAATWLASADGSAQAVVWDGALTIAVLAAFLLARPWRARSLPAAGLTS